MTLLTRVTQPVGISHVGRPPSFHDKAFQKPTQVYHMPTRGVPDQQQVLSLKASADTRTECTNIEAQLGGYKGTWYSN
ncbi:Epstein-Barr virus EBNA-1-like protein [Oryza sativa Japonica Group]|uniref:Epstein-Barr virus EBNA-1-like protein n=1 Tax=Oryza sativa subsp. japonica TaxID=39947 RepID=Q5VR21_ORYSJ|nr:Epstein-Barr virus EBNA-1-like protein [Oryza sativa Japonica Group]